MHPTCVDSFYRRERQEKNIYIQTVRFFDLSDQNSVGTIIC